MVHLSDFENARVLRAASFRDLLVLAEQTRNEKGEIPLILDCEGGEEEGEFLFPFSHCLVRFHGGTLISKHYANERDEQGNERTTWKTAALKVTGSHNIFLNLRVKNVSGDPSTKGQQVALGIYGDENSFINGDFSSTQDTLFVGPLPDDLCTRYRGFLPENERYFEGTARSFFFSCRIAGSVDFIFGAGQALFLDCVIKTVNDGRMETYVAAPSHSLKDPFGFVFDRCRFEKDGDVPSNSVYLARPWREYGKAVFLDCHYGDHIKTEGFSDWNGEGRDKTARFLESPLPSGRVPWAKEMKNPDFLREIRDLSNELRIDAQRVK